MNRYNELKLFSFMLGSLLIVIVLLGLISGEKEAFGITNTQAKHKIEFRESGGNPYARNGKYCGIYQMPAACNHLGDRKWQSKAADKYVKHRYGSWKKAWSFWQRHYWY